MTQGSVSSTPPSVDGVSTTVSTTADPGPRWRVTAGWIAHWLLRLWLALVLLVYGWPKVFLMQMGVADYGDALTAFGEMSPMGFLWRFMAFSPVVQVLAGLAEVTAAALLLFRRTAWLGGLLAAAAMAVVFLLNMTFDVPVKQLSLAMAVAGMVVAAPWFAHVGRILAGRPVPAATLPTPIPWPRGQRVTRWTGPILAVVALCVPGAVLGVMAAGGGTPTAFSQVAGVYRVVEDTAPPAEQLVDDVRWQQVAFGQHGAERARFGLRLANGDFHDGRYSVDGEVITIELYPVREGTYGLVRDPERTLTLRWSPAPVGIALSGDGVDVTLAEDPEFRYLFDRGFHWSPTTPVNR
ncbi:MULTISPECIES: hypothetical protein [unclassified Dietzia]|uniref:hypothetical protein n=1 Tax=unclassified Dietzia TaxID=2617939 RepID=UPI00131975AD|nr:MULTISPECIES: hypothetical protein [unclassified Dietzia]QGW26278.1 hypothetical protein GJR88_04976 [Dietzia sp. DQ12-45-1b]